MHCIASIATCLESTFKMSKQFRAVLCLLVFIISEFKALGSENVDRIADKVVHTKNGPVQGVIKQSRNPSVQFVNFWGLRYANPPPRFEPAKPLKQTWTEPKVANAPGNVCLQPGFVPGIQLQGSDDCLVVNVHVPLSALKDSSSKPLPVMFWVHGGGFGFGEGHTYGAEYLMENENVILVTANYRLGVLGFITMENDNSFTSNNGLRDLTLALKWVQENIGAFGGDADKVTIFGESAGSAAVHYLLMSPQTKGLYQRAIMQSGAFSFWSYAENPTESAMEFAKALGCPNTEGGREIRNCLESTPIDKLFATQATFAPRWPSNNPVPRFLPTAKEPQENAFFAGKPSSFFTFHGGRTKYPSNVPVMLGVTREEGSTLFTASILVVDGLMEQLNTDWNSAAPKTFSYENFVPEEKLDEISKKVRKYYFGNKPVTKDNLDPLIKLYTDSLMLLPTLEATKEMALSGMNAYPYIFSYYGEKSCLENFGGLRIPDTVGHADDLSFLFKHQLFGYPLTPDSEDEKFSKNLVWLWTNFAKNGVPDKTWGDGAPLTWNAVKTENDSVSKFEILEIDAKPKTLEFSEYEDRLEFWRKIVKDTWSEKSTESKVKSEL